MSHTTECLGYPSLRTLANWIGELAPGEREPRLKATTPQPGQLTEADRIEAVKDLCTRSTSAKEVAGRYGVGRSAPYPWKYAFLGRKAAAR